MQLIALIFILAGAAAFAWWLSGYDSKLTGNNHSADNARRTTRVVITVPLVGIGVLAAWYGGGAGGVLDLFIALVLAIIWTGCAAEFAARSFHRMVDPEDDRAFNPQQVGRELDRLAALVRAGRHDEAIALCKKLKTDGDASADAIDTMLFHLYTEVHAPDRAPTSPPLLEAHALCGRGKFAEAETKLQALLQRDPHHLGAALLLMRIYARDLRQPEKADALLRGVARHPHVPPAFIDHTRRSLQELSGAVPRREKTDQGVESLLVGRATAASAENIVAPADVSVGQLLARGHLATAIEILESQLRAQPDHFEHWLKFAEAHARHCGDVKRAGKIVAQIEANPAFNAEQKQLARTKLKEWGGTR